MGHEGEDGSCVPSLFHLTADTLSTHLRLFSKQSISDLPGTIVSSLVEFLSAEHLEEFDDVFQEKGIDTTRAWREHILKRWSQTYHFRPPVFKSHVTQSPKHQYFQKHFHESLRALLHYSSYDPSTPLREKLREQRCFELRSMNRALLKVDVNRYAKYAQSFVTSSANCNDIKALKKMMEALKKSTKVLEVYLHACVYRSAIITGNFIRFLRELKEEGCLEELHLHISNFDIREIFVEIIKECVKGGTARTDMKSTLKDNLSCLLGFKTVSDPNVVNVCSLEEGYGQTEKDLFDEALSTLPSRQPEKEFEKLLAATEKQSCSMEEEDMAQAGTSSETKESPQGKQLRGLAVYDLHCRAETARDLAHLLIGWTQLEKLSIHHFGGAGSAHHSVVEECDPDFALLCQVILHKVRRHQLTHLILLEQAVEREPLLAVVRFYTSLVQILNTEYRVSANQQRPLQFLRLPMICAMDEVEMFSGRILNNPVHAVEHLKVEIDPPYPQNREVCVRHIPAFLSGFLRFDSALTCLTIKDSSAYMYRFSDDDVIKICDAITECQRIEELELDFNLTSSTSVETMVDMIGRQRTLRKISILRIGLDWEEEKVKGVHEKLIEAVRHHQQLSHLTMKGPLGRALYGRFLVDFMISLFNTIPAPSLKHLDISETGTTTDDLFTVMAALRSSPCVRRGPVLEGLRVRNTVKCPDTTITMLPKLRRELKRLAHIVELSFEDHFGFQAELLAQV